MFCWSRTRLKTWPSYSIVGEALGLFEQCVGVKLKLLVGMKTGQTRMDFDNQINTHIHTSMYRRKLSTRL